MLLNSIFARTDQLFALKSRDVEPSLGPSDPNAR
jgi:hypothetical protein